ncbi:MAG: UDP-N-acetylmuramate--L-alanine ligase [Acidimicrobiales bacterium]
MPADRAPISLDLARGPIDFHIIGVGGANMNSIAAVLAAMGHRVSGSDQNASAVLERLHAQGVRTFVGHDAAHVVGAGAVAYSAAVAEGNVELAAARELGIPVLTRAEVLSAICRSRRALAVSGTHGKTTTTAMLAAILVEAGSDPAYLVGGELVGGRGGAHWGGGAWLVVEADESDGTFLHLGAEGVVVTSVEADHLDHYGDLGTLEAAFVRFVAEAPGPRVVCLDDPGAARVVASLAVQGYGDLSPLVTYGTSAGVTYRAGRVCLGATSAGFELEARGRLLGRFQLKVPGLYNVRNATAAVAMALEVGASPEAAWAALASYRGVGRRFELRGVHEGVTYVDDYAHNPGKVRAVLAAARDGGWERVVAVFQPHRYTRTAALWRELGEAASRADLLFVTGVYPAGEAPLPGVSGRLVADAARAARPSLCVEYIEPRPELALALRRALRPGDLCLTMSAGDLTTLPDDLLAGPVRGDPPMGSLDSDPPRGTASSTRARSPQ